MALPVPRRLPAVPVGGLPRKIADALRRNIGVGSRLLLVLLFFSLTQPTFFTQQNVLNILRSNTVLLLAALGMTLVILGGCFDLSIESIAALAGVLLAGAVPSGRPAEAAILLTVQVSAV